ncbi:MAG: hypothetical protein ACXQS8_03085, partial [Candidatus Helarchaeales archaeon]
QRGKYEIAAVSCFAAISHALENQCKVAVLNFSGATIYCNWTTDRRIAEDVVLQYQGDGTVLPIDVIDKLLHDTSQKKLVIIITDTELYNWEESLESMLAWLDEKHHLSIFFIGSHSLFKEESERFKPFLANGGRIYPISKTDDLIDLVIEEVRRFT